MQAFVAAFLALAFSGLLPVFGPWVHIIALVVLLFSFGWLLWSRRGAWQLPGWEEAARRLEQDSGVDHRPLQGLDDQPLGDDPQAMALWQAHQRQLAAKLAALKPKAPESSLARLDRFALRGGALLVLFVALFLAGTDALYRLGESFQPTFASAAPASPVADVWIEPPNYTRLPPVFAQPDMAELAVPAGSTLVARVSNAVEPVLTIDAEAHPLAEDSPGSHGVELELHAGERMELRDGAAQLVAWNLDLLPDQPPLVLMPNPPSGTERFATRIDFRAEDDYGVTDAWAELRLADGEGVPNGEPMRLSALLGDDSVKIAEGSIFQDLTPHRWAGRVVEVVLIAADALDQRDESVPARLVLPERTFNHPVAQRIISHRKLLDAGEALVPIARSLVRILEVPGAFNGDAVVFLGISALHARLHLMDRDETRAEARASARDLMWDLALRLEDGGLSAAEKALRAAQRALQEALARNASDEEIARLVEELRRALREFARQMAENAPLMQNNPAGEQQNAINSQDLEEMLDRIRELSQTGARDAAQELLAQMQRMLENLRNAQVSPEQQQQAQEMMQRMNELEQLRQRQQQLMDQTFQRNQQGQRGNNRPPRSGPRQGQMGQQGQMGPQGQMSQEPPDMNDLAELQEAIRRELGELMRQLGEGQSGGIPQPLQDAEQEMRGASQQLQKGDGPGALGSEGEALKHLEGAAQQMANQFARQMGMGQGQGSGNEDSDDGTGRSGRDPLGREGVGGQAATVGPKVPEQFDIQRARRIRDELYRRSADPARPPMEQEYLRRLLERF